MVSLRRGGGQLARLARITAVGALVGLGAPAVRGDPPGPGTGRGRPVLAIGHPHVSLVAYEPLTRAGNRGGLVVELSVPTRIATDPVWVSVEDASGLVVQTGGTTAFVPALAPATPGQAAQTWRVRLPLELAPGWQGRFDAGVSLRVVTTKPGVTPGAVHPGIVVGAADLCRGEGCNHESPAYTTALDDAGIEGLDAGVAASDNFVVVADERRYAVYRKSDWQKLSLAGTALEESATAVDGGGAATLFAEFWTGTGAKNINLTLAGNRGIPCDPTNPASQDVAVPPGITTPWIDDDNHSKGRKPWQSSSCINEFYDTRVTWDRLHKRFWIVAAGRNRIWNSTCESEDPGVPGAPPRGTCDRVNKLALRLELVAVSKQENPLLGFHTFLVARDNADWPIMSIHNDFAIFNHADSGQVRVFDAGKLAAGELVAIHPVLSPAALPFGLAVPAFDGWSAGAVSMSSAVRAPKHLTSSDGITYLLARQGDQVSIHGLTWKTAGGVKRAMLLVGGGYSDGRPLALTDAAYADGQLYLVNDTTTDKNHAKVEGVVLVRRIPVYPSADGTSIVVDRAAAKVWELARPTNQAADYPTVDVTRDGHVVVSYRSFGAQQGNQARYVVLYKGEPQFRASAILRDAIAPGSASGPPKRGGRLDFQSSALDPADRSLVWLVRAYANSLVVGAVPIHDPPPPPVAALAANARLLNTLTERCGMPQPVTITTGRRLSGPEVLTNLTDTFVADIAPGELKIHFDCDHSHEVTSPEDCRAGTDLIKVRRGADRAVTIECYATKGVAPTAPDAPDAEPRGEHLSDERDGCDNKKAFHKVHGTKLAGDNPLVNASQHAVYKLADKRFSWYCGDSQEWTTCHEGTNLVRIQRTTDDHISFDCMKQ